MIDEMGFDAVFIGTGAGYPTMLGIPGESLNGVLSANELLTRCNLMRAKEFPNYDTPLPLGRRVAVVGAGNTAMDAMRVCLRLGAEGRSLHLPPQQDRMPRRAPRKSITPSRKACEFHWLTNPVEILDDGKGGVRGMRCIRMELGEPDESGPAAAGAGARQRARDRDRPGRIRDRHERQSDHGPDVEAEAQQVGLHRRRTRTSRRRSPACLPAATSSPARPP